MNILELSALLQEGLTWALFFDKFKGCVLQDCKFIKTLVQHGLFSHKILFLKPSKHVIKITCDEFSLQKCCSRNTVESLKESRWKLGAEPRERDDSSAFLLKVLLDIKDIIVFVKMKHVVETKRRNRTSDLVY